MSAYKVGDLVKIVDEWPNSESDIHTDAMDYMLGGMYEVKKMHRVDDDEEYIIDNWYFTNCMIAGLAADFEQKSLQTGDLSGLF